MTTITQTITSIAPAANPATMTRDVFSSTAAANVLGIVSMTTELNTWAGQVNTVSGEVSTNATNAAASAVSAAAAQAAAEAASSATVWISGTSYIIGNVRWSPLNYLSYRRTTNGAGTTDPSLDTTNWAALTATAPAGAYQITYLLYGGL